MNSIFRHLTFLVLAAAMMPQATAQRNVNFNFNINVPPFMSIEALRGPDSAVHPMTTGNVVLSRSRWRARSSSLTGSTVTFETDHSFWNQTNGTTKRDAVLRLTRLQGPRTGGWGILVAQDQTDYANGDEQATVTMASFGPGMQLVNMEVEFVTGSLATLQNGSYELTVVGTISEN